ncbi:integral membrane protein, partial [Streptomyces zinciresistens K42]
MPAARPRRARPGSDLRILRAAVFAAVCVVLAGIGHALASCAAVPLWALGAGYLGIFLVALPFTGRERSLAGTAALLAVCQTSLHSLFGVLQQGAAAAAQAQEAAASDAALVRRAARLLCGTAGVAISPARAQRVLSDAGIGTGGAAT